MLTYSLTNTAEAKPYTPGEDNEVIAVWDKSASRQSRKSDLNNYSDQLDVFTLTHTSNQYLRQAALPGSAYLYGVVEAMLKPFIENNTRHIPLLFAWAQVLQHQHKFVSAQDALRDILALEPNHIAATLLAARLQLIQGNPASAHSYCLKLLGHADLLTLSTCSLEARSYFGEKELAESYKQLQKLVASNGMPEDERQQWVLQILADMAVRLQLFDEAANFLELIAQPKALSVWVQWADINLALNNNELVSHQIKEILKKNQLDDALMIRLVIAEKKLSRESQWESQLRERIALRELRDDGAHAADLALYHLFVSANTQKALYWAERNWLDAREYNDEKLLKIARQRADTDERGLKKNADLAEIK